MQVFSGMKHKNSTIFSQITSPDHIMPDQEPHSNRFGKLLKKTLHERSMSARDLARETGHSEAGISRILSGETKPRPGTLQKIIKAVARHPREEESLLHAFHGARVIVQEEGPAIPLETYAERLSMKAWEAKDRVIKIMEHRAEQSDFRAVLERVIKKLTLCYKKDFAANGAATDFVVEFKDGTKWGIESRFEIHRNLEATFGFAYLVLDRLDVDEVLVVTPFNANINCPQDMPSAISLCEMADFSARLAEKNERNAKLMQI